ncbi:hypothetical protein AB6A40_009622 [Gnathostoma spinigerum]|uniref:UFSP1/2/DUB catalytic domain-containing protein n=1 Tax=Gnathostoma spinigerum TaxID=75299 RepID=A0ABD6ESI2_9BILA
MLDAAVECCGLDFDLLDWVNHIELSHSNSEILPCPACYVRFSVSSFRDHITNEHLFRCPYERCPFISISFETMASHTATHSETIPSTSTNNEKPSVSNSTGDNLSGRLSRLFSLNQHCLMVRIASNLCLHAISSEDRGYGCGYRNLQIIISSIRLDPDLGAALGLMVTPSITAIQSGIETAWRNGFDPDGAAQLHFSLKGTRKWIGATEVAVYLQSHFIRVELIDFERNAQRGPLPARLFDWVFNYFRSYSYPLYFQHAGHSRTIIGVEETRNSRFLLIYDPFVNPRRVEVALSSQNSSQLSFLRCSMSSLTEPAYQIVAIRGVLSSSHYDIAKTFTSFNHSAA